MNLFALGGLILGCTCLLLAVLVSIYGRSKIHKIWVLFNLSVGFWGIGAFLIGISNNPQKALFAWRIAHIGGIFIPVCFFHTVCIFCKIDEKYKKVIYVAYLQGFFFLIINWTNLFMSKIVTIFDSIYYQQSSGFFYPIFFLIWVGLVVWGHLELIIYYKNNSGAIRNQILYLFIGMFVGFLGGTTNFLPMFNINFYPIGNFTIPLYCFIVTYAILKYQLLDIKIAVTRTGIFIFTYSIVLGIPFFLATWSQPYLFSILNDKWWLVPLSLMAILATVGPFVYIFLERKAEARILRAQKRYQNSLKQAAIGMTRIRDLNRLLNLIVHIVTKTVKISHAAIYLYDERSEQFLMESGRNIGSNQPVSVSKKSTLMIWLKEKQQALVYDQVKHKAEETPNVITCELEEQMRTLNAAAIIPGLLEYNLGGFLILGEKKSKELYTEDDLAVFQVLTSQATLAIENAKFIQESRIMQEQISHTEKMATIGTMDDGLSHQINNRFHALSLIAGDTLDIIKSIDGLETSMEVKNVINQIKYAMERIKSNVVQGGEVVSGLLKYTRSGEQGFDRITLDQIVDGTLAMVCYKIKLSEIDIVRNYSQYIPNIRGNLVQLEEVFFNLIDNAYDSTTERKLSLTEPSYRGKIIITAELFGENLRIKVEDNGIGVKPEDQKRLFTPFFTTKASSHKGTGLGLYVIRRIIVENHNGRISFESAYKKGTAFYIDLPIYK